MKKIYIVLFLLFLLPTALFAKINDVPFISQVLPGNWNYTLNCGQTSYYMVLSYINGVKSEEMLNFREIEKIDDWLYKKYGDPIRDYNGYYTTVYKIDTIAKERDNIKNSLFSYGNNDFEKLKVEIDLGNVVIVSVRINMDISKEGHFMVLIGYDDKYVYLNDPGKMLGRKRKYLIQEFFDAWKTQNYSYVLIKPNDKVVKNEIKTSINNKNGDNKKIALEKKKTNDVILLNKTINTEDRFLQTVIKNNENQLQIITVDAEMDKSNNIDNTNTDNVNEDINEPSNENAKTFPFLDENNWMHINDNLIIDYNIKKVINNEDDNKNNKNDEEYNNKNDDNVNIDDNNVDENFNEVEENKIVGESLNDKFDFNGKYIDNSLKVSLFWTKQDDLTLYLDVKSGYGDWENIPINDNQSNYDYYIKENNTKLYFRLRAFDGEKYSDYRVIEKEVNIIPLNNLSSISNINTDTILGKDNTYFCDGDCIVEKDVNLLVEDGVKIKMGKGSRITFLGNIFFMGGNNKIYIMPNNENNKAGDIGFIYFFENDYVELNNVDIGYGGYIEFYGKVGDMIQVDNVKNFIINNSYFHNSYLASGANMNIVDSNVYIKNSKFSNSLYGFKIAKSKGIIQGNEFSDNHYNLGLYNVNNSLKVYNNKILNGINQAIFGQNILADIKDNILENNKFNLISMTSLNIESGEFTLSKGIYNIYESNIGYGAILRVPNGTIFKSYTNHGRFKIYGKLLLEGTLEDPIIFTSFFDDYYGGDSNLDGNAFSPKIGDWGYLEFSYGSHGSEIRNTLFEYGGNYSFLGINHGVVYINGGSDIQIENTKFDNGFYRNIEINDGNNISIINSKIYNANIYGIDVIKGKNILIKNNEFIGNKNAGICYMASYPVNIEENIFKNNMNNIVVLP